MTPLSPEHLQRAAYIVTEEVRRRRQFGHPIPRGLLDLEVAMRAAVATGGHETPTPATDTQHWCTADVLGQRLGVSARTIRRNAERYGGRKLGREWAFPINN